MPAPRDTATDIWARQLEAYRAMGPEGRFRRAVELSEDVKSIARDGIRDRHPDWADTMVELQLVERLFGRTGQRGREV
jgi:hypothetical protein